MERVGRQEGLESAQDKVGLSPYEVLIVASMIEREAKVAEDRAKIARVIYNRLRRDMELQIDATVRYQQPTDLPFTELVAIDTPYNSYLYKGLPPTPIANPGRASIAAAMNPAPNPDLPEPEEVGEVRVHLLRDRRQGGWPHLCGDTRTTRGQCSSGP
jgi:UPF0755 protein